MRKAAGLILTLLIFTSLAVSGEVVKTFHIVKGENYTFELPKATITIENTQFQWINGYCVIIHAVYPETGGDHKPCVNKNGSSDPDKTYIYYLKNIKFDTWTQTIELENGEQDPYNVFSVKNIDVLAGKVTILGNHDSKERTLSIDSEVWVYGVPKAKVKLVSINVDLFSTTAKFQVTYYDPVEADIVVETYQEQQSSSSPSPAPSQENQTNATTPGMLDPTKIMTAMIIVGENAAGADVAAGAKVGIAVQKWIDESDSLVEMLPVPSTFVKIYKEAKKTMIRADAMLDTEVTDPNKIAPIVYSVGGPAANQYSAMLNNRTDIPVRFIKENGKWYLVSKYGDKWSGSYGVIEIIPSARTVEDMKRNLMNGDIKMYDILVAGLDRKGTYAACKLLNTNFMGMLKGEKPSEEILPLITLQAQITNLFSGYIFIDQTTAIAIIVDENGKIVKVISG